MHRVTSQPDVVATAHAKVQKSPRGAPETLPAPVVPAEPPCGLETAPVGSKVVVVTPETGGRLAVFQTTNGEQPLAVLDLAHRLPVGAKVCKVMEGRFEAQQLNPSANRPALVTATAREAMEQFVSHFHRE